MRFDITNNWCTNTIITGGYLTRLAKYDQAEKMLHKALAGWKTTMTDHPSTYMAVQNLSAVLLSTQSTILLLYTQRLVNLEKG